MIGKKEKKKRKKKKSQTAFAVIWTQFLGSIFCANNCYTPVHSL